MQNNRTPLYWVSYRGHTKIVAMLLKFGADFRTCDNVSTFYYVITFSTLSEYINLILIHIMFCGSKLLLEHVKRVFVFTFCSKISTMVFY